MGGKQDKEKGKGTKKYSRTIRVVEKEEKKNQRVMNKDWPKIETAEKRPKRRKGKENVREGKFISESSVKKLVLKRNWKQRW